MRDNSARRNRVSRILIVTALTAAMQLYSLVAHAQASQSNDALPGLARVREELRPQFGSVRFTREEQWEERFVVRASPAALTMTPRIFRVQVPRFELVGDSVITHTSPSIPTMYVAAYPDASRIYKLGGFTSAEAEFNRLVSESPEQKIRTEAEAESRGLMCAEIVYVLSSEWWLSGASSAQLQAAKHFFDTGHADALRLSEKWWKAFKGDPAAINITTTRSDGGFVVNLPIFWAPVEGHSAPEIKVYRIDVSERGACHRHDPVVYR